jgi:hypothetical protein
VGFGCFLFADQVKQGVKLSPKLVLSLISLFAGPLVPSYLSPALVACQADFDGSRHSISGDRITRLLFSCLHLAEKLGQLLVLARFDKLADCVPTY